MDKEYNEFIDKVRKELLSLSRKDLAEALGLKNVLIIPFRQGIKENETAELLHKTFPYHKGHCACCGQETNQ